MGDVGTIFRPRPGQVVLVEPEGATADGTCLTGLVVTDNGGDVTIDLGVSARALADGTDVVASIFAPEALYRLHATAHLARSGLLSLDPVREVERVQRRTRPRRACNLAVTLLVDGQAAEDAVAGRTLDLGPGGMRVETVQALPGDPAEATVTVAVPRGPALVARVRVVHVSSEDDDWEYRLAFSDLSEADTARIARLGRG